MTIIVRRPWTRQPQVAAQVNWSNPITRGLCFLVNYADPSLRNIITGDIPVLGSGLVRSVGANFRTAYSSAQPNVASWPGTIVTSTGNGMGAFSVLSYSAPVSEANLSALISQSDGNGLQQLYLLANTNIGYSPSAGFFTFGARGGLFATVASAVNGQWRMFICTRNEARTSNRINLDGVDLVDNGSDTGDGWEAASTSRIFSSGINGYTNWTRAHPHALQAAWNRELSGNERLQLARNPWQLFAPRRIIIPTAAAAGYVHPTLSNARMGSLTSTTGVPLVDYAF